ncbi:MAG: NADAR family protein [Bacteriovoracaceae bacterium]
MKCLILIFILALIISCTTRPVADRQMIERGNYPTHWFQEMPKEQAFWWEILPEKALAGEVILSKRNELGLLSNFASTPFTYHGKKYASVEGFWQMMKFPESKVEGRKDPRQEKQFSFTREAVSKMVGLDAKFAGDAADKLMKELAIDWVSFEGKRMRYCQAEPGSHYKLIREAMMAKIKQNPKVKEVLLSTGDLILRPDHIEESCPAPEWKYYNIWMEIRQELMGTTK